MLLFHRYRLAAEQRGERRMKNPPRGTSLAGNPRAGATGAARGSRTQQQADPRDPKPVGEALQSLIRSRGWSAPVAVGSVISRWPELVGTSIAEHCRPESFADGVVVVSCDSTAWATNLKLMKPQLFAVFERELGRGIVTELDIRGPQAPSWKKGRYSVRGRGPRDTYG